MSPELAVEKKENKTMPLAEMKEAIFNLFVNKRLPENTTHQDDRKDALEALELFGTPQEDTLSVCQMKKTLDLMKAYISPNKNNPGMAKEIALLERVYSNLMTMVQEKFNN